MNELHFGVVVGIDRYPDLAGAKDLSYARSDAKRFHEWLVSPTGGAVPKDNVKLLQDPGGPLAARRKAYPTQRDVNDVFADWKTTVSAHAAPNSPAWNDTRIYIYVAGHGYAPPDGVAALLLADAADDQLGYHLEIERYVDWLSKSALFREVLVFSDCCRRQYRDAAFSYRPPFGTRKPAKTVQVFALLGYAALIGEDALEPKDPVDPDQARGVFTGAVLDGLEGGAADKGEVTSSSLATYVRSSVESRTKAAQAPQRVEFSGDLTRQITVCKVSSPPRRKVTVSFPAGAIGQAAEIRTGAFEVVESQTIDGKPWPVELEDALYELAPGAGATGFKSQLFKVAGEDIDVNA